MEGAIFPYAIVALAFGVIMLFLKIFREKEKAIEKEDEHEVDIEEFEIESYSDILMKVEEQIAICLYKNDIDSAIALSKEMLESISKEEHAIDKHFSIIRQLDLFYPHRYDSAEVSLHCMDLCNMDILDADETLKELRTPVFFVTPTRLAIMLEQQGRLDEAISVCDWAIEHDLWDYRKNSFSDRKTRLLKKKEKGIKNG